MTRCWFYLVLVWMLAGCGAPGDVADAPGDATDMPGDATGAADRTPSGLGGSARTLIAVTLEPDWVAPGAETVLRVEVPDAIGLLDGAWVNYEGGSLQIPLTRKDDMWFGEWTLVAPGRVADHRVDVRSYYEGGEAVGYGLLSVSSQPACPAGERRQAGHCYPAIAGGMLSEDRRLLLTNRHFPERTMAHPRASRLVGDKLIGCITDAMAIMRLDDLVPLAENAPRSGGGGIDSAPAWTAPYSETMLQQGGLGHCNDMVFDETRSLAEKLRHGLVERVEHEHTEWMNEVRTTLDDGRIVRALRLSS
ncbi:MAG: hypothetical protein QF464_13935, partial [Myxococcota bacterium]|nr:hypothetical protein [Myxococcota bacterium]